MHKRLDLGHVISMTPIGCSLGSSVDQVLTKWPTQQCHSRWQHLTFGLAFPGHINAHDCPAQKWLIAPKLRSAHRQGLFIPDYSYPKEVDHTWGFIIYHSFIYYSLLQKKRLYLQLASSHQSPIRFSSHRCHRGQELSYMGLLSAFNELHPEIANKTLQAQHGAAGGSQHMKIY